MENSNYEKYQQRRLRRQQKNKKLRVVVKVIAFLVLFGLAGMGGYKACAYVFNFEGKAAELAVTPAATSKVPPVQVPAGKNAAATAKQPAQQPAQPGNGGDNKDTSTNVQPLSAEVRATKEPHDYSILIKKGEFHVYLVDGQEKVAVWNCALGKNPGQKQVEGDMKTPDGTFTVDEIDDASSWSHDFGDGKGEIAGAYGPWFLSLDTSNLSEGKWGGIGIHGTHDPNSIGTLASEGCIRLDNQNLRTLKQYARVGMKVVIEE